MIKFDLDDDLRDKIKKKDCNADFVSFLVDYFLGESEKVEVLPEKLSTDEAYRKRIKRAFKKAGEPDKWMKSILKKPGRKAFPPIARKNKYGYSLIDDPKRGRPRNSNFWALIYCLKEYLKQWRLIMEILYNIRDDD